MELYQYYFDNMNISNFEFHEGLPDLEKVRSLLDDVFNFFHDLIEYTVKSIDTQNLFLKYCHNYKISAILFTQNVFAQGTCSRTMNIKTSRLVLFASKRDESQALNLCKQLYTYFIIDCDPKSPRKLK